MTTEPVLMTTEQLLAMPEDDGVERDLLRGRLREVEMSRRSKRHTRAETTVGTLLENWVKGRPAPRGQVLSGDAGFTLTKDPDTTVGIDVAYISPETAAATPDDAYLIDGLPVLAVEILSPSDTMGRVTEKVAAYLDAGVPLVWLVEPVFRTVTVFRPDAPPVMFNVTQRMDGGPHLPGFAADVAEVFAD